jgi:hypothetical protein
MKITPQDSLTIPKRKNIWEVRLDPVLSGSHPALTIDLDSAAEAFSVANNIHSYIKRHKWPLKVSRRGGTVFVSRVGE